VIVEAGTPAAPDDKGVLKRALVGAFGGLLLGLVLAVALDRSRGVQRDPDAVERLYGVPALRADAEDPELAAYLAALALDPNRPDDGGSLAVVFSRGVTDSGVTVAVERQLRASGSAMKVIGVTSEESDLERVVKMRQAGSALVLAKADLLVERDAELVTETLKASGAALSAVVLV